jgi:hypothetical protein
MVININNMAQVWTLQSSDYIERYVTSTKESYMKFGTIMAAAYVSFGHSSFNPLNMFMPETILAVRDRAIFTKRQGQWKSKIS